VLLRLLLTELWVFSFPLWGTWLSGWGYGFHVGTCRGCTRDSENGRMQFPMSRAEGGGLWGFRALFELDLLDETI
jgi:hypothetical protein